ncbi:Formimidoyltetrahydrofolate cyclodeaminase [Caloramator quimbayensis]|uniref:Formimidoyltetrahydrofolate cyclodeaminase n=1 Tax=Caloramator quimbayensis TaxID=1147123 RepID=A0A1T4Y1J3_9CLOT|nr:cyclodeaminase/cyclohydrolase family protein [Caloramator quimbayensis]SKA95662.1 Formimidoyltetrahydrofolate cyclodeaminase [Caloramator quimbayensis]
MLSEKSLLEFLDETASNSPVPGGGSIAALSGAISAALTQMVANLTVGKKGYENVQEYMPKIIDTAGKYREGFVKDIDEDAESFNEFMKALKMPKNNEEEIKARKEAIEEASKKAALVPLKVAKNGLSLMDTIEEIVLKGNKNAITDGAVAAMMARTAVLSALYNVKINLLSIKDENFVKEISKEVSDIEKAVCKREEEILKKVVL